ncbi:hypothetical protein BJX64DRAFT_53649 [Aspergillus heterothallicus]
MFSNLRLNKSCDQCRHRKIRCIVPRAAEPGSRPDCTYCSKRGQKCTFSVFRAKPRVRVPESLSSNAQPWGQGELGDLFIDRVLQHGPQEITLSDESSVFTTPDEHVPSSGLAFFSEQKVQSLTERIGDARIQGVVKSLDDFILHRLGIPDVSPLSRIQFRNPRQDLVVTPEEARLSIEAYFVNLHPVYPFLDRGEFEAEAFNTSFLERPDENPVFSALYHAVLALGSQFLSRGTFEPGKGRSWELFDAALRYMADVILPRESIESVQALTALSIYAMNTCAFQLDDYIISHVARMAITLRYHKNADLEAKHLRVFWVIYGLEKQQAMHGRACSIIPDEDIGCAVPPFPEAQYGDFNLFMAYVRIARISSIAGSSLHSVSAQLKSTEVRRLSIEQIGSMLEAWRISIPEQLRPGTSTLFPVTAPWSVRLAALQLHFIYYHIVIALERLSLYLNSDGGDKAKASKERLMNTARTVIELTRFIEMQPHVPIFILAVLPVSAVFILFDLVIHNPYHPESQTNLSLLETAAGYFSLVDIASNRVLPGSIMAEFTHIARQYYWNAQQNVHEDVGNPNSGGVNQISVENAPPQQVPLSAPQELEYPVPPDFEAMSGVQAGDFLDIRTMFGWVFPDSQVGEDLGLDLANLGILPEG